jgi:hypothetical protein
MSTARLFSILALTTIAAPELAAAQLAAPTVVQQAAAGDGWMSGVVVDQDGAAVRGASILASGAVIAVATTDARGQFTLTLPIGDYLVRASRLGFVSTYREPVRVQPNQGIERRIRLTRAGPIDTSAVVETQELAGAPVAEDDRHRHSEMAWRLRHLRRTVLRTVSPNEIATDSRPTPAAWFDVDGHVNLFAAGPVAASGREHRVGRAQNVANVFVGAPVGDAGRWAVRAAMVGGTLPVWAVRGEYDKGADARHDVRLAVSYSTRALGAPAEPGRLDELLHVRRAGVVEAADRWMIRPALGVDYGVRLDHFDYLPSPVLLSPRAGVRFEFQPGTSLRASAVQRVVGAGANDFRSPTSTGLWLPAVHSYALASEGWIAPQRSRRFVIGIEQALGDARAATVSVHWLAETTDNQMATVFNVERESGGYGLVSVGDVSLAGWRLTLEGEVAPHVSGRLQYTDARARWSDVPDLVALGLDEPAIARRGRENVSNLQAAVDVAVPASSTRLTVAYHLSRLDPVRPVGPVRSVVDHGVDVEVRQPLPYRPLDASPLHLLFSLTTMLYERGVDSLYDEALTLGAPARLTAGIQVGF